MPIHPNVKVCTHIMVTGVRCGSPALRGEQFCYFHQRMMRGVPTPPGSRLHPIALVENEEAIQASLMEVIDALARNTIDLRRADLILKALYIAVKNSRRVRFGAGNMVEQLPDYPLPPQPAKPPAPVPVDPVDILGHPVLSAPPLLDSASIAPSRRKPQASVRQAPAQRKNVQVVRGT